MSDDDGEDWGQKVDVCTRIREILKDYPEGGTSLFKEYLQNADDAGAQRVCICFDSRRHDCFGPPDRPYVRDHDGPALLIYNDAAFTQSDLDGITRIGASCKRSAGKIGRFGVGFNCSYHLTDVPCLVTGRHLIVFDPHARYCDRVNPLEPGKKYDFVKLSCGKFADRPGWLDRFRMFGFDPRQPFPGTMFRLPLRTPEQASCSELSKTGFGHEVWQGKIHEMLRSLQQEAPSLLLFLRSVVSLDIYHSTPTNESPPDVQVTLDCSPIPSGPRLQQLASLPSPTGHFELSTELAATLGVHLETIRACKPASSEESEWATALALALLRGPLCSESTCAPWIELEKQTSETLAATLELGTQEIIVQAEHLLSRRCGRDIPFVIDRVLRDKIPPAFPEMILDYPVDVCVISNGLQERHSWFITSTLGHPSARQLANENPHVLGTLAPWVAVAAPRPDTTTLDTVDGRAFCFLPLPISTRLPMHVHGFFEVASNRRSLWWGDDMSGDGRARAQWNNVLLCKLVAEAVIRMLLQATTLLSPTLYELDSMESANSFLEEQYEPLWPHRGSESESDPWDRLSMAVLHLATEQPLVWSPYSRSWKFPRDTYVLPVAQTALATALDRALLQAEVHLAAVPRRVHDALQLKEVTPAVARRFLHKKPLELQNIATDMATLIFEFLVSDLDLQSVDAAREMFGIPVLPIADGTLTSLASAEAIPLFLCTPTVMSALPDSTHSRLVAISTSNNFCEAMRDLARGGNCNLQSLNIRIFAQLLQPCVKHSATNPSALWAAIRTLSPDDLVPVAELPIVVARDGRRLCLIETRQCMLLPHAKGSLVLEFVERLGGAIFAGNVTDHPQLTDWMCSNPKMALHDCLVRNGQKALTAAAGAPANMRDQVLLELTLANIAQEEACEFAKLPLFRRAQSREFVAISEQPWIAPQKPSVNARLITSDFLDPTCKEAMKLAARLGCPVMGFAWRMSYPRSQLSPVTSQTTHS